MALPALSAPFRLCVALARWVSCRASYAGAATNFPNQEPTAGECGTCRWAAATTPRRRIGPPCIDQSMGRRLRALPAPVPHLIKPPSNPSHAGSDCR